MPDNSFKDLDEVSLAPPYPGQLALEVGESGGEALDDLHDFVIEDLHDGFAALVADLAAGNDVEAQVADDFFLNVELKVFSFDGTEVPVRIAAPSKSHVLYALRAAGTDEFLQHLSDSFDQEGVE
mgnify:CR=1 FL=1